MKDLCFCFLRLNALLVLFITVLGSPGASAQETEIEWRHIFKQDSIEVHYTTIVCDGRKELGVLVVNNNPSGRRVAITLEVKDGNNTRLLEDGVFNLEAQAAQVLDCNTQVPHLMHFRTPVISDFLACSVTSFESTLQ